MKLTIQGQGDVTLTKQHFVAAGGQGEIYALGDTAFKVYHDSAHMMPIGKIQELSQLPVPMFSRPEHMLLDAKGKVVGYTTRFVKNAYVLCQLFPRSFRDRERLTHDKVLKLVEEMRKGFDLAHKAKILLIDPNEMNFLVDPKFATLTFIDTDSYQTQSYPATVIMESIRDRHMAHSMAFNEGTDWFSFAITSFQMLVGIHPYKGKHPTLKGFDERMKANVSVLNKDVGVPSAAYPLDMIPKAWRGWYEAVLERGERSAPPGGQVTVTVTQPVIKAILGAVNLVLDELGQFDGNITGVWTCGHQLVVATDAGVWMNGRRVGDWTDTTAVAFSPRTTTPIALRHPGDIPELYDCTSRTEVVFGLDVQRTVGHDGRVYFKAGDKVLELVLFDVGNNKVVPSTRVAASVLPNASLLFPGGVYQNMLGSAFVSLFPQKDQTFQIRIPELDVYRVLDARYDAGIKGGVLMVVGRTKSGTYDRLIFRFNADFTFYDMRKVSDVGPVGLNFVVTDAGVCVCLDEEDKLELSSITTGSTSIKTVTDNVLGGDLRLFKHGAQVLASRGNALYSMRLK